MTTKTTKSPIRRASHLLQDAFHYAWGVFSTDSCLPVETRDNPKPTVAQRSEQFMRAVGKAREAFTIISELAEADRLPLRAPRTHAAITVAAERLMQLIGQVAHAHGNNAMCDMQEGVEETAVLPPYYRVVGYDLAAEQAETARKRDEAARERADHDGALRETKHATASKTLTPDEWAAVVRIAGDIARSLEGNFESDEAIEDLLDAAFEGTAHASKVVTNMKISLKAYCDTRGYFRAAAQLDAEDAAHVKAHGLPEDVATLRRTVSSTALAVELLAERLHAAQSMRTADELRDALRATTHDLVNALDDVLAELDRRNAPEATDETETERRTRVAAEANISLRKMGVAPITLASTREQLCNALQAMDPNGSHTDELVAADDGCDPYSLDDAWYALAEMVS